MAADLITDDTLLSYTCIRNHRTTIDWGTLKTKDHIHCPVLSCNGFSKVAHENRVLNFGAIPISGLLEAGLGWEMQELG